jgi:hypothetical protein
MIHRYILIFYIHHFYPSSFFKIRAIASCLSLRRIVHILHRHSLHPEEGIYDAVHRAALSRFLPIIVRRAFESSMREAGIVPDSKKDKTTEAKWPLKKTEMNKKIDTEKETENSRGGPAAEAMIPSTLFFDNPQVLFNSDIFM